MNDSDVVFFSKSELGSVYIGEVDEVSLADEAGEDGITSLESVTGSRTKSGTLN